MKTNRRFRHQGRPPSKRAQRILKHPCPKARCSGAVASCGQWLNPLMLRNTSLTGTRLPRLAASWAGPLLREERLDPPFGRLPEHLAHFGDVRAPLAESRTSSDQASGFGDGTTLSDSMRCQPSLQNGHVNMAYINGKRHRLGNDDPHIGGTGQFADGAGKILGQIAVLPKLLHAEGQLGESGGGIAAPLHGLAA